jgi:hypothetical protein
MRVEAGGRGSARILVAAAALAAAVFAARFEFADDAGVQSPEPNIPLASPKGAVPRASSAYLRAFVSGVPPKFEFDVAPWSAPLFAPALARGDFNGDGRDDLAAVGGKTDEFGAPARLYIFLQSPAGALGIAQVMELPRVVLVEGVSGLASADLNEDGRDDLVLTSMHGAGLMSLVSSGDDDFQWRTDLWNDGVFNRALPQVADFDGDGHLDVVASLWNRDHALYDFGSSQLATWFGDGQGGFARHASLGSYEYSPTLWLAQLDGTGPPDLLSTDYGFGAAPRVLRADGAGGWLVSIPLSPDAGDGFFVGATAFDVNGDGRDDAVLSQEGRQPRLAIHLQQPDGSLSAERRYVASSGPGLDRPADLDGNGLVDLVQGGHEYGRPLLSMMLQDAYGLDYPVTLFPADQPMQAQPMAMVLGDFNGDGITDVALSAPYDGIRLWRGSLTPFAGVGTLPPAPGVVGAEADPDSQAGAAVVTLSAPADSGGSALSGYTVYAEPGGGFDADAGSPALVHRVTGLSPGLQYTFRARAANAAGKGPPSTWSAPVTIPVDVPTLYVFADSTSEPDTEDAITFVRASLDRRAPPGGVTLAVSTQDGTAQAGSDYEALAPTTLHIPAGEWNADPVPITIHGDFDVEGKESFNLVVTDVQGATLSTPEAVSLYEDDSEAIRLVSGVIHAIEGDSGTTRAAVPLVLSKPSATDTVIYLTDEAASWTDAASPATDYVLPFSQVVIPAGQTVASAPIDIVGDTLLEHPEVAVIVASLVPFPINNGPWPAHGFVLIQDNDPVPTLSLSSAAVQESDDDIAVAHFKATLSSAQPDDAWFSFETVGGTAAPGIDFEDVHRSGLAIRAGQTELDVPVVVYGDRLAEGTEQFGGRLVGAYGVEVATATATASILDNDAATGISVTGVTQPEGNAAGTARFIVELAAPQPGPVSFDVRTTDGTAFAGSDYTAVSLADLVLPAGQTRLAVDVPVLGDLVPEASETFGLEITRAVGATPMRARALARLVNDDTPTISISDASVVEGTDPDGAHSLHFTVALSSPAVQPVTYWLKIRETGSAVTWYDMRDIYVTPTIDPGRTRQSIDLTVLADDIAEGDETFEIVISAVHGATIGDGVGIGTIIDDDAPTVTAAMVRPANPAPHTLSRGGKKGLGQRPGARGPAMRQ